MYEASTKDRAPVASGSRSFFKIVAVLILLLLIAVGWYANQLVFLVTPEGNQKQFIFDTFPGGKWHIEFTHSVQKTPVEEFFIINGVDDMVMQYTRYQSLGVGLPFLPSEGKFTATKDGHFILEMNRPYKKVQIRTAMEAKPKVYYADQEISVYEIYQPGSLVEMSVVKRYRTWFK